MTSPVAVTPVSTASAGNASRRMSVSADRRTTTRGSPRALMIRSADGRRSHLPSRQRMAPPVTLPPARRTASPSPISSRAASALGQILIPAPVMVSVRCSSTVTSCPARRSATAVANPAMPAPITVIRADMP